MMKLIAINKRAGKVRRVVIPMVDGEKMVQELRTDAARFGWEVRIDRTDRGYHEIIEEIERELRA